LRSRLLRQPLRAVPCATPPDSEPWAKPRTPSIVTSARANLRKLSDIRTSLPAEHIYAMNNEQFRRLLLDKPTSKNGAANSTPNPSATPGGGSLGSKARSFVPMTP